MTKEEFKTRWESGEDGGGIFLDDIVACAVAWGICQQPRTRPLLHICYLVLKAAGTNDAEAFNPANLEE